MRIVGIVAAVIVSLASPHARADTAKAWTAAKAGLPAEAKIVDGKIEVSSPQIAAPKAVRYAWKNMPDGNLWNGAGLPASPFRTDDWPRNPPAAPAK